MIKTKSQKAVKGSVLEKKEEEIYTVPDYTDEQIRYLSSLQRRLERAKTNRDQPHTEFDNMDFIGYWWANERGANTTIQAKVNKGETVFQSGTLRTKMLAFLSTFQGLNLQSDIAAFNKQEIMINTLGNAMEDIIDKTRELENDEEWKMIRQYEMLKHGYVFVEEMWHEPWIVHKEITKGFYGQIANVKWTSEKIKGLGRPKRSIIPGPGVYLGDLTKYMSADQPYIFSIEIKPRVEAEQIYGDWENWEHVSRTRKSFSSTVADTQLSVNAWRLMEGLNKDQVEIIKYQDKPNNEFQIILNGVPMLPLGFPLTAISADGEYTITQQNLEPIRHNFAYGKSFIFKNKNIVAVLDQMMKLAVLKTQKSFLPPHLNVSNRVIPKDVLMPGKMTMGLQPGDVVPVSEHEAKGVTTGEFRMIQETTRFINENTVSPTFTGAKEAGGKITATQIIELQRQARLMMGLLVLAASLLEKKLDTKRLMLLLDKWFDPIDTSIDEARKVVKNRYRVVSRERTIDGEGKGIRMVILTEDKFTSTQIKASEDKLKKRLGLPIRMIVLNPVELKRAKLTWVLVVNPKEKKSSEMAKILFGAMVEDALNLGLRVNFDYIEQRFAEVWEEDPSKMFGQGTTIQPGMTPAGTPIKNKGDRAAVPSVKLPGGQAVAK